MNGHLPSKFWRAVTLCTMVLYTATDTWVPGIQMGSWQESWIYIPRFVTEWPHFCLKTNDRVQQLVDTKYLRWLCCSGTFHRTTWSSSMYFFFFKSPWKQHWRLHDPYYLFSVPEYWKCKGPYWKRRTKVSTSSSQKWVAFSTSQKPKRHEILHVHPDWWHFRSLMGYAHSYAKMVL